MTNGARSRSRPTLSGTRGRAVGGILVVVLLVVAFVVGQSTVGPRPPTPRPEPSGAGLLSLPIESGPPQGPNLTARENLRRGTAKWELPLTGAGAAEGYFGDVSVAPGEDISLHLRSSSPSVNISVVRLGWYGGEGARLVGRWRDVPVAHQPEPTTDPRTGLIVANWSTALTIHIPADWVSGLYLAVLQPGKAEAQYASFVVREATPTAPILWVSPVSSHEAYNPWGGKSLYPDNSKGAPTLAGGPQAVQVSFDRPFEEYRGAGRVLRWEYPFVRWMESQGYDVGYASDVDLQRDPSIASGRRLILFVGHPEYWSQGMRKTVDAAIARGTNVAFFSANEMYWRIRLESVTGPLREVTCYRRADLDPLAASDPQDATTKWRDEPASEPESLTVGQMYGHIVREPADFVVSAPDSWIYAGTGVVAGDRFSDLVGQEYDRYWPSAAPPGVTIVATSPVSPNFGHLEGIIETAPPDEPSPSVQNATIYTAPSGATVFAAGTMQWAWALDDWGTPQFNGVHTPVDARVQAVTRNILDRLSR